MQTILLSITNESNIEANSLTIFKIYFVKNNTLELRGTTSRRGPTEKELHEHMRGNDVSCLLSGMCFMIFT